jgi:hypothetical protein
MRACAAATVPQRSWSRRTFHAPHSSFICVFAKSVFPVMGTVKAAMQLETRFPKNGACNSQSRGTTSDRTQFGSATQVVDARGKNATQNPRR